MATIKDSRLIIYASLTPSQVLNKLKAYDIITDGVKMMLEPLIQSDSLEAFRLCIGNLINVNSISIHRQSLKGISHFRLSFNCPKTNPKKSNDCKSIW